MKRRDMITGVAASAAFAVIGADTLAGHPEPNPTHGVRQDHEAIMRGRLPSTLTKQEIDQIIRELDWYVTRCTRHRNRRGRRGGPARDVAMSIPFATIPINVYLRTDKELNRHVPEPKIHTLLLPVLAHGGQAEIQAVLQTWSSRATRQRRGDWTLVDEITTQLPRQFGQPGIKKDRIVSARYCIDLEELDCYALADLLAQMLIGIAQELNAKTKTARKHMRTTRGKGETIVEVKQRKPIEVYAAKQAYMFEAFAWVVAGGILLGKEQAVNIPVGTLGMTKVKL